MMPLTYKAQAVLDFLSTTNVGRRVPGSIEEDAQSEAQECGAGMHTFFCPFYCFSSVISLVRSAGLERAGQRTGGATKSRKDSEQEPEKCVHRHDLDRSHAINELVRAEHTAERISSANPSRQLRATNDLCHNPPSPVCSGAVRYGEIGTVGPTPGFGGYIQLKDHSRC